MINVQVIDNTSQIKLALINTEVNASWYEDEVQALNAVEENHPSVVLLNYEVRKEQTADYINLIRKANLESKIIIIANELNEDKIIKCLIAGAKGYQEIKQLEIYADKLIRVIDAGEAWITRRMVAILLDSLIKTGA